MMEKRVHQPIEWIDSDSQLETLCEQWLDMKFLAIDTEFMRSQTYYPIAGLIQVNDGQKNYLIDPKAITDFYPLIDVLDSDDVLKIIHSCSEDLDVFQHLLGCVPKNLLDTQIAAALCGYGFSLGFANLVNAAMGIDLPKEETRSDWLQRPLSAAQIQYAAQDVEYLYSLVETLMTELESHGRLAWALEDSRQQVKSYYENQNTTRSYLRYKSAWKFSPRQLAVLQALSNWREHLAQDKNMPRNRIVKEPALLEIAQKSITDPAAMRKIHGISERMVRDYGRTIAAIVNKAKQTPEAELPAPMPKPLNAQERAWLSEMKAKVEAVANTLNIPQEILARKKDYETLIHSVNKSELDIPESFEGWRKTLIAEPLIAFMRTQKTTQ